MKILLNGFHFEWSHTRVSSTDVRVRSPLYRIIDRITLTKVLVKSRDLNCVSPGSNYRQKQKSLLFLSQGPFVFRFLLPLCDRTPLNDTLEQAIESADSQFNLFISSVPKSIY